MDTNSNKEHEMVRRLIERVASKSFMYFLFIMSMLAAFGFIGGMIAIHVEKVEDWPDENIPEVWLRMAVSMMCFSLFFPWFTALYFARWFMKAINDNEAKIRELEDLVTKQH